MSQTESILNHRIARLNSSVCLLGQPDIISIRQTKFSTNFFNKQKKIQDIQQNFINGLIFPTTAHFSSFISTRYKARDPTKLAIKARLFMFDAYGEKDVQIEINIPGSLEIRTFNLRNEELPFDKQDYERAYYSSFLRSMHPMNYPNIILYPLLNRFELFKSILKNFIAFSYKNELRELNYDFDIYRSETAKEWEENSHNLSIELLIGFCIENHYTNILKTVLEELKKINPAKYYETDLRVKQMEKKYGEIICKTAEKLLFHGHANRLKEHQIEALFPLKKYAEVAYIGKSLLQSGGTSEHISKLILISLMQINEDLRFLKSLNLVNNLHNFSEKKVSDVSYQHNNHQPLQLQTYVSNKAKALSEYSEFIFPFDNTFYNRLQEYKNHQNLLKKNSKEGLTLSVLDSIEESLNNNPLFYDVLVRYEKTKGWKTLMKYRTDSFWLETDFNKAEENFKTSTSKEFNDNYSFFEEKFQESENQEEQKTMNNEEEDIEDNEQQNEPNQQAGNKSESESFDGDLSEHEQQKQSFYLPKCSAKVTTTRRPAIEKRVQSKILCGMNLQKLFMLLYNDIKLQNTLQTWEMKLKEVDFASFSIPKRQLTAMIYLKKGLVHRKLQRNKKCEESLKMARKLSCSSGVNLVAIYQLLLLYIDNKNTKGVEFYLVELLKLFKTLGVQTYDLIPEWAKPIIHYVLSVEGLAIVKNIHPIFKAVFSIFLRTNYTEEEVEALTQVKKEK